MYLSLREIQFCGANSNYNLLNDQGINIYFLLSVLYNLCNSKHCSEPYCVPSSQAGLWYVFTRFGIGCCDVEAREISMQH